MKVSIEYDDGKKVVIPGSAFLISSVSEDEEAGFLLYDNEKREEINLLELAATSIATAVTACGLEKKDHKDLIHALGNLVSRAVEKIPTLSTELRVIKKES